MTTISNNDIARAIYLASKDKQGPLQSLVFSKVASFLARRHLLGRVSEILLQFKKILNYETGSIVAKVSSSVKLQEQDKKDISHILHKRYTSPRVSIEESIDAKL